MSVTGWLVLGAGISLLGSSAKSSGRVDDLIAAGRLNVGRRRRADVVRRARRRPSLRTAREAARRRALLAALRLLVAEMTAGTRPADALCAAATMDPHHASAWQRAADVQRGGTAAAAVLCHDPDLAFVGHAWAVAAATGAAPAEVLQKAAADVAAHDEQCRAVHTALAGARASAAIMAALPALGCVLGTAMGARPIPTLFGTAPGRLCLVVGLAFDAAGLAWTARIARRASVA